MMKENNNKPIWEEEKISQEEQDYQGALELIQSIDCVTRFERKILSLEGATRILEVLGDYKDSAQLLKQCRERIVTEQEEGFQSVYEESLRLEEEAGNILEYKTVITEFNRIADYKDAAEHIDACKKEITRQESVAIWKNRGIALACLLAAFAVFWITPAKPYTKGVIHKQQGKYQLAILNFREADGFINSAMMIESCKYQQAVRAYQNGNPEKALKLCRQAEGKSDANVLAAEIELEYLKKAEVKNQVVFGKRNWTVLEVSGGKILLLLNGEYRQHIYDDGENTWSNTWIHRWLYNKFRKNVLNSEERKLLLDTANEPSEEIIDKVFLLNETEFLRYQDSIPADGEWWLRTEDSGLTGSFVDSANQLQSANKTEEKNIRPAIWVSLEDKE